MRASHRQKDEARSTKYRPFYTHASPQPIVPGEIYKLDIEVMLLPGPKVILHGEEMNILPGILILQELPFGPLAVHLGKIHPPAQSLNGFAEGNLRDVTRLIRLRTCLVCLPPDI